MKVSLNWLKEYVETDLDPTVLEKKLTMAGLEVEAVEPRYDYLDQIVVARVNKVDRHPNADKLFLCRVDAGKGHEDVQIVCGAPNVREGLYVPCALPGVVLPGEFKIKKGKIRGELSDGMLCSAAELRLAEDAAGIMELEGEFEPGASFGKVLNVSDTVFEIDLTPNRPDCLSFLGIAREVAAFSDPAKKINPPDFSLPQDLICDKSIHDYASVDIIDPDLCPRYSAGLLFDVKIEPSPFWLQQKLESIGLTPINNVVDITNFVMMETGQPLHAFDFDKLAKNSIIVKKAGNEKKFTTLDSKEHALEPDMLMICDGQGPVAVAGVMGGENSEISDSTTRVLVESAYFNPVSIRKTAKLTGMATDASHRFERGMDPRGTINALNRALSLMAGISGASIAKGIIDEYPEHAEPAEIHLKVDALNTRLGTDFSVDETARILESVEFQVEKIDEGRIKVTVPSFRVDVTRPEDLSEEVARLWGYDRIQTSYPLVRAKGKLLNSNIPFRKKIRDIMTGFSFFEAINYNFIHEESCNRLGLSENDKRRRLETILNPISDQMSVLRSSMIPGLLETMKRNISFQEDTLKLFEMGKVFFANQKGELPEEKEALAGLITGSRYEQSWYSKKTRMDFYDLKGYVEGLLAGLKIDRISFEKIKDDTCPYFKMGHAALIKRGDRVLGSLGRISGDVLKNYSLKQDAFVFDLDFKVLHSLVPESIDAEPLPKFPSVSRDLTIIVDSGVTSGMVVESIGRIAEKQPLIEAAFLFDAFEGKPLAENKKSLSFRIVYRSSTKTLKEKNIKKLHTQISSTIIEQFDAGLPE